MEVLSGYRHFLRSPKRAVGNSSSSKPRIVVTVLLIEVTFFDEEADMKHVLDGGSKAARMCHKPLK
jgi:hypothetical protein